MKKNLFFGFLLAIACIIATGCSSCQSENNKQEMAFTGDRDRVAPIQAMHKQTMFTLIGGEYYQWRNSKVLFNDTITFENIDEVEVTDVTDVFFYWNGEGPHVQQITTNVKTGTVVLPVIHDVWIEDANLSDKPVRLTVKDVLNRLKEWNGVLPPAMSMSLRYPVGPCECNAQWVIGDVFDVIFIDAVTGEISNWNPAFNPNNKAKGGDFGKPLGEWP